MWPFVWNGQLLLDAWSVWTFVRRTLREGTLIRNGEVVFEILGITRNGRPAYWVRKFKYTVDNEDFAELLGGD